MRPTLPMHITYDILDQDTLEVRLWNGDGDCMTHTISGVYRHLGDDLDEVAYMNVMDFALDEYRLEIGPDLPLGPGFVVFPTNETDLS